jgi:hypothetical protein
MNLLRKKNSTSSKRKREKNTHHFFRVMAAKSLAKVCLKKILAE